MYRDPVIVTGAGGFIGRHLVGALASAGLDIRPAFRRDPPAGGLLLDDQTNDTGLREALAGAGAVIHLAGRAHRTGEAPEEQADAFGTINREWPLRLAAAGAAAGVRHFLFVSTIGVHGTQGLIGHDSPLAPGTAYARSKAAAEAGLREEFPGHLVILRPPLVAGPGAPGNLARLARLASLPLPLPFGAVRNRRSLLSMRGLCRAIGAVLERWGGGDAASGAYVLADAAPVSTRDIVTAVRAGMARAPGLVPIAPALLRGALAATGRGAMAGQLLDDLVVDPSAFQRDFPWRPEPESLTALRELGAAWRR
ncbi:NAD-dependent epimerase/dehydratase family protein [Roseococcus thiosulfatophilus]|uniref:NAD-dependent epimerase/dehydratase family protein n=1 Tax=Roseococcus thiosulfatophilus TaxID=35813 RepID=UPI001A8D91D3|nr:NAD-dependent epimerase/dehydratase family protein [Roseococcus thiosulfatophilus]